jgi:hypothetical protein
MAIFAIILSSMIGFVAAVGSYLALDVTLLSAFGIYFAFSMVLSMTLILTHAMSSGAGPKGPSTPAREMAVTKDQRVTFAQAA